jgi:hypothetical protein
MLNGLGNNQLNAKGPIMTLGHNSSTNVHLCQERERDRWTPRAPRGPPRTPRLCAAPAPLRPSGS